MLYTMSDRAVAESIPVHERMEAMALICDGERCCGVVARNLMTGELVAYWPAPPVSPPAVSGASTACPPTR
jgi:succinate dehydrogenase/fumarate reductase flavoprotein subunit